MPIEDPDTLLEGCQLLLRALLRRIVSNVNSYATYSDEPTMKRIKITRVEIHFVD